MQKLLPVFQSEWRMLATLVQKIGLLVTPEQAMPAFYQKL